jgi:hypothetical protein
VLKSIVRSPGIGAERFLAGLASISTAGVTDCTEKPVAELLRGVRDRNFCCP